MNLKHHFELLASYNLWINTKVYKAASDLAPIDLAKDRGAFFGSILGTLNHLIAGDTIWLRRFATHPSCATSLRAVTELPEPTSLSQIIFDDFSDLHKHRNWLDKQIINWIDELSDADLNYALSYHNTKGVFTRKCYSSLLLHFFNHQTHHRGQVSALLSQAGSDVGITDLLVLIPEESL
ncbi:DinB family protein [Pseudomonas sp.]|uniref:DinB family protein n=1 Tax=Pseudomonas sp. TaxID=306 RepID=UPI002BA0D000|nr:DinB family protein [Pseudomonas sp.]HUE92381.1 DinB family protein [Pseudomonas sp.]